MLLGLVIYDMATKQSECAAGCIHATTNKRQTKHVGVSASERSSRNRRWQQGVRAGSLEHSTLSHTRIETHLHQALVYAAANGCQLVV